MRVAIYARVSTDDRGQDPENQLAQLRAWFVAADHLNAAEFVDHVSGGKGADKRPQFAAMLDVAHRLQFDILLVWALDRLSREGMVPTILHLQRLAAAGVAFHSASSRIAAYTPRSRRSGASSRQLRKPRLSRGVLPTSEATQPSWPAGCSRSAVKCICCNALPICA